MIFDYIGIAANLKKVLADYASSGGKGKRAIDQKEAVAIIMEKYEVVCDLFHSFN